MDIRLDMKESQNSVYELSCINSKCAMKEIVGLMDLPDGANIRAGSRKALWQALRRQAKQISRSIPPYNPEGSVATRKSEQLQWQKWLKLHP
jgi:hypothetical protein